MVLLFLHIVLMFGAVALGAGMPILVLAFGRRGELDAIRALTSLPFSRVIPALYVIGGVFGLATALSFGYDLLSPWLVIAYVLFAFLAAYGALYSARIVERVHAATADATRAASDAPPQLRALRTDTIVSLAGIALIIADMVFKPFS